MDKRTHLLGSYMKDRSSKIKYSVVNQVLNKEWFNHIYIVQPLMAKLMIDKFLEFLNDSYFTDIERQMVLMEFLNNDYDLELIREVISFASTCKLQEDYTLIIMEWNLVKSEAIKKANLYKYDGAQLLNNLPDLGDVETSTEESVKKFLNAIINLDDNLLNDEDDSE